MEKGDCEDEDIETKKKLDSNMCPQTKEDGEPPLPLVNFNEVFELLNPRYDCHILQQGDAQADDRIMTEIEMEKKLEKMSQILLGPYEMYVLENKLKQGVGTALIDTGAQISLIKESALIKSVTRAQDDNYIQGITRKSIPIIGKVELKLNDCQNKSMFHVVKQLPGDLDIILGQGWLQLNNYLVTKQ